jgi:hypothetical protein
MNPKVQAPQEFHDEAVALQGDGLSANAIVNFLKRKYPNRANEITLIPGDTQGVQGGPVRPASPDLHALTHAVVAGMEIYDSRREAIRLESQAVELERAEKAELNDRVTSLEQAMMRTDATVLSHLVDHQLVQDGQRQALSLGRSIQFLLAGRDQKTRAELLKDFGPEEIDALELAERTDALALPTSENAGEKVVDVVQKKRGIFGLGG